MKQSLKDLINKLGNENAKKIFLDYYDANQGKVKAFLGKIVELEKADNIFDNIKMSMMPIEYRIMVYMKSLSKDPAELGRVMGIFLEENEESVIEFVNRHPLYAKK